MKKNILRFFKLFLFFILMAVAAPTFALAVLGIVPSSTAQMDLDATFPTAAVTYTVTNNTTQIAHNIYLSKLYGANSSLIGATLSGDTCSHQDIAPSGTCSFTLTVFSKGVTGTTTLAPQVCKSGGVICSVPVLANRITVNTYDTSPVLRTISPSFGSVAGGNTVTITGFNFIAGTTVNFGGQTVTPTIVNTRTLTAVVPSVSGTGPQTVNVSVTTSEGGSNSVQYVYYSTPTITTLSPNFGQITGGNTVTITGTNFIAGDTTVSFGGTAGTNIHVTSSTSLSVTAPAHSMSAVSVTVTTSIGTSNGVTYSYYGTPTVTSVSPTFGTTAGGTSVSITGTNFTSASTVKFGTVSAASVTYNSSTSLTAVSPPGTVGSTVNIIVTTLGGVSQTSSADQFTYYGVPTITSLSTTAGPVAGGGTMTITGTNFIPGSGNTTVSFGGTAGTSVNVTSTTSLTVTIPAHTAGSVNVTVTTVLGTSTETQSYLYCDIPTITSLSPSAGPLNSTTTSITITGTNFIAGQTSVTFGSTVFSNVTVSGSGTTITLLAPSSSIPQSVNVTVTTPGGTSSPPTTYNYYAAPTTTSISPSQIPIHTAGVSATIVGTNFVSGSTTVNVGTTSVTPSSVTPTSLTFTVPAGPSTGPVNVTVTTPGGTSSPALTFTYYAITLTTNANTLLFSFWNSAADTISPAIGTGYSVITVTNPDPTYPINGFAVTPPAGITTVSNACLHEIAPGASCTIQFSTTVQQYYANDPVTLSADDMNTVSLSPAPYSARIFAPPMNPSPTTATLMLVSGCATPQFVSLTNTLPTGSVGTSVSTDAGLPSTVTTGAMANCPPSLPAGKTCVLEMNQSGLSTSGSGNIIVTMTGTGPNPTVLTGAIYTGLEASGASLPAVGSTIQGDYVYATSTSCNTASLVANAVATGGPVQWAQGVNTGAQVPNPATGSGAGAQDPNVGVVNTVATVYQGFTSGPFPVADYAANDCLTDYTENNSANTYVGWYLPANGEASAIGVHITDTFWTSTEATASSANYLNASVIGQTAKGAVIDTYCSRLLTY